MKDMLPGLFAGRTRKRRLRVPEALDAQIRAQFPVRLPREHMRAPAS